MCVIKRLFQFRSLQTKIMSTFLLFMVAQLIVFSTITYWYDSRSLYQEVSNANLLTVEQMTNVLDTQISTINNISEILAASGAVQELLVESRRDTDISAALAPPLEELPAANEASALLHTIRDAWQQVDNIYIYALDGRSMGASSYEVSLIRPQLTEFQNSDTRIVYGTVLTPADNTSYAVFSYFRLVKASSGVPLGWLRIDLNLYSNEYFSQLDTDERVIFVMETSARIIYTNRPEQVDIVVLARLLNAGNARGSSTVENLGKESLASYYTSAVTGWMTVMIVPQELVNTGLLKMRSFALTFIAGNVLLAMIGAIVISRRITRPLRTVFQTMKKIETGDFRSRIPVMTQDEIGELARRLNSMVENIDLLIKRVYKSDLKNQEAQLLALRAQLNPHLLYNTLESMDALALKGDTWKLHQMIESLAIMLRYALQSREVVTLREELRHLDAYLRIQKIKYGDAIIIVKKVAEEDMDVPIPQLMLQPIVENAFKYAFFGKIHNRMLLTSRRAGNVLTIQIVDNGVGTAPERLQEIVPINGGEQLPDGKIGLRNVHQRIRLMYGEPFGIQLSTRQGHWFKVTLTIPLREEHDIDDLQNWHSGR